MPNANDSCPDLRSTLVDLATSLEEEVGTFKSTAYLLDMTLDQVESDLCKNGSRREASALRTLAIFLTKQGKALDKQVRALYDVASAQKAKAEAVDFDTRR